MSRTLARWREYEARDLDASMLRRRYRVLAARAASRYATTTAYERFIAVVYRNANTIAPKVAREFEG